MKSFRLTTPMKSTEQKVFVAMYIALYQVITGFETVVDILFFSHWN